jgi:hypothetical protein
MVFFESCGAFLMVLTRTENQAYLLELLKMLIQHQQLLRALKKP